RAWMRAIPNSSANEAMRRLVGEEESASELITVRFRRERGWWGRIVCRPMTDAPPNFAHALALIDGIEGWLSTDQAERLWKAAVPLTEGARLVEIGSFRGRSAVILATAAGPGTNLVAIDPHAGNDRGDLRGEGETQEEEAEIDHKAFNANLEAAGVRDRVHHIRKFSHDAIDDVPDAIDLLYVDGAHQYEPAVGDIRAFGAKVKPGGTMLVHDS